MLQEQAPTVYVERRIDAPHASQTVYVPIQYDQHLVQFDGCVVHMRFAVGSAAGSSECAQVWLALLNTLTGAVSFAVGAGDFARQREHYLPVLATAPLERTLHQVLQSGLTIASLAHISFSQESAAQRAIARDPALAFQRSAFAIETSGALDLVCAARVTEPDEGYCVLNAEGRMMQIITTSSAARAVQMSWSACPEAVYVEGARSMALPCTLSSARGSSACAVPRCGVANCWVAPFFVPRTMDLDGQLVDMAETDPLPYFDRRLNYPAVLCLRAEHALARACPRPAELAQPASYMMLSARARAPGPGALVITPDPHARAIELSSTF